MNIYYKPFENVMPHCHNFQLIAATTRTTLLFCTKKLLHEHLAFSRIARNTGSNTVLA